MRSTSRMAAKEHIIRFKNRHIFLARRGEFVALGLLIVIVSVINVVWLRQDTRPQPGVDANIYLANTFYFVERPGEVPLWESVAALSHDGRPPLYQLLSVPFLYLFGRSADAALLINVVFGVVLLLSVYGIGRLVQDGKAGLLAALLAAAYPPLIGLSRIYRPHFALSACVGLNLWLLLLLLKTRSTKIAWLFGASLGFGMLIHLNTLFLSLAPTILFGFYMLLFQTAPRRPSNFKGTPRWLLMKLRDPFALYGLLPAALIAVGLTAIWYLPYARTLYAVRQSTLAEGAGDVTRGFPGIPHFFGWYALTMPGAISYVFTALLAIGLLVGTLRRRPGGLALVITFLAMYIGLGLRPGGMGWLYFASALPIVAALTAVWIVDVRHKLFSVALTLICVGVAAFNFSTVTWGVQPWGRPIALALGAPLDSNTCAIHMSLAFCPWPAQDEDWRVGDILQVIQNDPDCQDRSCRLMIVQGWWNIWYINYSTFHHYLAQDFPRTRLEIHSTWSGTWADQLQPLLNSEYVLYRPDNYAHNLRRFLLSPPPAFADAHQQVASFEFPNGTTAKLVKRVAPLTFEETAMSIAALDFSQEDAASLKQGLDRDERIEASAVALDLPQEDIASLKQWLDNYRQYPASEIKGLLGDGALEQALALSMQTLSMLTDKKKADLAVDIGGQLLNMGEITRAIELLNQVASDTNEAGVWIILGKAYRQDKKLDQAIAAFEQALALDPRRYWANHLLAGIYANQGQWQAVIPLEQAALGVAPDDARYVDSGVRLVQAYKNLEDQRSACVVLRRVAQWAEPGDTRIENLNERLACQD